MPDLNFFQVDQIILSSLIAKWECHPVHLLGAVLEDAADMIIAALGDQKV